MVKYFLRHVKSLRPSRSLSGKVSEFMLFHCFCKEHRKIRVSIWSSFWIVFMLMMFSISISISVDLEVVLRPIWRSLGGPLGLMESEVCSLRAHIVRSLES